MSIRSDAAEKRIEDLSDAMIAAGKRLKGVTTTGTCKVFITLQIGIAKVGGHARVVIVEKLVDMHVWPVGLDVQEKFSELKFAPGMSLLVMLADVREDDTLRDPANPKPAYFIPVTPREIDKVYTGNEVRAIIKSLNYL